MRNRLVSVILPCYNCESTILDAVNSITSQTYQNLEILLCNDGSSDGTLAILLELEKRDARIKVVDNPSNLGLIDTLNNLVNIATGEYIARMDSDDICELDRIEQQVDYLVNNQLDGVGSSYTQFGDSTNTIIVPSSKEDIAFSSLFVNPFCHPSVLMKASVLKKHSYNKQATHVEDYDLWSRLISAGYKLGNIPSSLLKYRVHNNQISNTKWNEQISRIAQVKASASQSYFNLTDEETKSILNFWSRTFAKDDIGALVSFFDKAALCAEYNNNYTFIRKSIILTILENSLSLGQFFKLAKYFSLKDKCLTMVGLMMTNLGLRVK